MTLDEAMDRGWTGDLRQIARTYEFPTYGEGLQFAAALGQEADRRDHHPEMTIGYKRVTVCLTTHDQGGVTDKDLQLAETADRLAL